MLRNLHSSWLEKFKEAGGLVNMQYDGVGATLAMSEFGDCGRDYTRHLMGRYAQSLVDFAAFVVALALYSLYISFRYDVSAFSYMESENSGGILIYSLIYIISYQFRMGYASSVYFIKEMKTALSIIMYFSCFDITLTALFIGRDVRLYDLALNWVIILTVMVLFRISYRQILVMMGIRKPVIVLGTTENAVNITKALMADRFMLIKIIGYVTLVERPLAPSIMKNLSCRNIMDLDEFFYYSNHDKLSNATVYIALDDSEANLGQLVDRISTKFSECVVVPNLRGVPVNHSEVHHVMGRDFIFIHLNLAQALFPRTVKRCLDVTVSLIVLMLLAPLLLMVSTLIWANDRGPIIYSQERVGQGSKAFKFYKFRSMVTNADAILAKWGDEHPELYWAYVENNFKLVQDPRVTRVGAWLRRSSIDELPQLINVLRGDMSIVGPRPILEREIPAYEGNFSLYGKMRPGITGLWQVSGRSATTFRDRASFDEWYVRNWSLWLDVVILFKTIRVVLMRGGAH